MTPTWLPSPPAPIVPTPVGGCRSLRGQRVIVGDADHGWHGDLRADDPIDHNGHLAVPVLHELDYYRAELANTQTTTRLMPAAEVWVEQVTEPSATPLPPPSGDVLSRLVQLDAPPPRAPIPARDMPRLTGCRVVLVSPTRTRRDVRASSEPYQRDDATICVRVCPEPDWYRWALTGQAPTSTAAPIYLVWVE